MKHKKVFIFDLDNTIYFNENDPYYNKFHNDVYYLIKNLYEQGKIIAIITYNLSPESCLEFLNIKQYVSFIYKPIVSLKKHNLSLKDIYSHTSFEDIIYYYPYKSFFIKNLKTQKEMNNIINEEIIFFDDSVNNIRDVKNNCNIECIHVNSKIGLDIDLILKKMN